MGRHYRHSRGGKGIQVNKAATVHMHQLPDLLGQKIPQSIDQTALTPWPMSLDMTHHPFFQFEDPSSPFLWTREVGSRHDYPDSWGKLTIEWP